MRNLSILFLTVCCASVTPEQFNIANDPVLTSKDYQKLASFWEWKADEILKSLPSNAVVGLPKQEVTIRYYSEFSRARAYRECANELKDLATGKTRSSSFDIPRNEGY